MTEEVRVAAWQRVMARAGLVSLHPPQSEQKDRVIASPRYPSVPDLRYLDMMFVWNQHKTDGRAMAETECMHVQDTEYAMDFAVRAFAFHGWEIERGQILLRADAWVVLLVFTHPRVKHGQAGRKRIVNEK